MKKSSSRLGMVVLGVSFALAGCGGGTADVTLDLSFGSLSCGSSSIVTLSYTAQSPQQIITEKGACKSAVEFENIQPGNYTVTVNAYDTNDNLIGIGSQTIQVWGFGASSYPVSLTAPEP